LAELLGLGVEERVGSGDEVQPLQELQPRALGEGGRAPGGHDALEPGAGGGDGGPCEESTAGETGLHGHLLMVVGWTAICRGGLSASLRRGVNRAGRAFRLRDGGALPYPSGTFAPRRRTSLISIAPLTSVASLNWLAPLNSIAPLNSFAPLNS